MNVPLDDLRARLSEIPADKPVWLYCGVGLRGYLASNILKENGYKEVRNLIGGLKTYKAAIAPLPSPKIMLPPAEEAVLLEGKYRIPGRPGC